jgi:hypothetical protein
MISLLVDVIVEFNKSAFRHNISKEDILHAIKIMLNPVDDNTK